MSDENDIHDLNLVPGKLEAFPLPRTMPANWDLSTLDSSERTRRSSRKRESLGQEQDSATPVKNGRGETQLQPEKASEAFPQPRTLPASWELSD